MSGKERQRVVDLRGVERGVQSLAHHNPGCPSNRRQSEALRQQCFELYRERLEDFGPTLASEQLAGHEPATAFGRVCQKLGIEIIRPSSPQAKGRIDGSHSVYQDRLVKHIGLDGFDHLM